MRTLIFISFLLPHFCIAQRTDVFIKLSDARGKQIKGDAVLKGFENWLGATSFNTSGKGNTQISFTTTITGASADLKRALANGEFLDGQVVAIAPNPGGGVPVKSYVIKMEKVAVISCDEKMGCNSTMNTTVTLQITRIGWTYYNTGTAGVQTISRKFGWDAENNVEWSSF